MLRALRRTSPCCFAGSVFGNAANLRIVVWLSMPKTACFAVYLPPAELDERFREGILVDDGPFLKHFPAQFPVCITGDEEIAFSRQLQLDGPDIVPADFHTGIFLLPNICDHRPAGQTNIASAVRQLPPAGRMAGAPHTTEMTDVNIGRYRAMSMPPTRNPPQ